MRISASEWSGRFGLPRAPAEALAAALEAVDDDPEAARLAEHALERAGAAGVSLAALTNPLAGTALARLAYAAPFLVHHSAAAPERLPRLLGEVSAAALPTWAEHATPQESPALDEAEFMRRLRRWKYDAYFRVTARHLAGLLDAAQVCRAISDLADGMTAVALAWSYRQQAAVHGLPVRADGGLSLSAVLGMGKLGGQELNYASDIDLILLHDGDDHPTREGLPLPSLPIAAAPGPDHWREWARLAAALGGRGQPGRISNGEFHQRVGRQLVRVLSARTEDGIGFRVDADLRPEGRSGLLVTPLGFALAYYDVHGREWERAALIKARPIAGSPAVWEPFLETVRPFVYRRYLDFSAVEGIALVKHDIDRHHQAALERDIKLGAGGIRENEFLVQALQLLHGGRRPELRSASHDAAVRALAQAQLLPPGEAESILGDYWLLRERENRLQMVTEAQTQALPDSPAERLRVFHDFRPGFPARLGQAAGALEQARERTAARFRSLFSGMELASGRAAPEAAQWRAAIAAHAAPGQASPALERVDGLMNRLMRTRIGERCVFKVAGLLTRPELYLRGTDDALPRWLTFLDQIGNRNALLTLLEAHPPIVPWVSRIFAEGGRHAEPLIRHPEFLESFLGQSMTPEESIAARLASILADARDDEEFILDVQTAKAQAQIRILSLYLDDAPPAEFRGRLSDLADAVVAACTAFSWRALTARLGLPEGHGDPERVGGFAVLALGKLGSRELRFSSDLDLVFLYERDGSTAKNRSHYELFTKIGHRIGNLLTAPTQFGKLYELDHRLRPFGTRGLLVPSLAGLRDFLAKADVWNFQAFTRMRLVSGDGALAAHASRAVGEAWAQRRRTRADIGREVKSMLDRLVAQNAPKGAGPALPLKFATGGMLGFEFLSQFHFLAERSAAANWTPPPDHAIIKGLRPDYDLLSALDERVSFHRQPYRHVIGPDDFSRFAAVGARWRYDAVAALCRRMTRQVEDAFSRLLT